MSAPVVDPVRRRRILVRMRSVSHAQQIEYWHAGDVAGWLYAATRTDRLDQLLAELEAPP